MRIVKKYWLPLLALVLAIGLAVWRIGYLERTNTSLSMEIGSRKLCRTESRSRWRIRLFCTKMSHMSHFTRL